MMTEAPRSSATTYRSALAAWGGYALATLLFFSGALPGMGHGLPGGPVAAIDGWQNVWHLWWVEHALAAGQNPFFTPLLFYPQGVNLAVHPLNLSNGLLLWPITVLFGPLIAYNLALLLAFWLAGVGGFLLARRIGVGFGSAFVAGLLFSFAPFHVTKAYDGQLELIALQWLPLYLWLLLGAITQADWRQSVAAGLMLAVIGYTSLYYLIFIAFASVVVALLWMPLRAGMPALAAYLGRLLPIPAVAVVALTPLLSGLFAAIAEVRGTAVASSGDLGDLTSRSADLVDFWLPSYLHPLWGSAVGQLGPLLHPNIAAWNHALGYTTLALALIGLIAHRSQAWRWALIALAGLFLALGPNLHIAGVDTGLPLPYRLLMLIPGMDVARRPGHFVVLTVLALTPLAALGLQVLFQRFGWKALGLVTLVAAFEYAPPLWQIHRADVHPIFAQLAGGDEALLVLPINNDSSESLQQQLLHGRPLVGGFLARIPPYPFAAETPGVRELYRLRSDGSRFGFPAGATPAEVLDAYGIRDVLVRWDRIAPADRPEAEAVLAEVLPGIAPYAVDGELSAYRIPVGSRTPFAYLATGWYPEEQSGERRWRWMSEQADIVLMNPSDTAQPITLTLRAESFGSTRPVTLQFAGAPLTTWNVPAQPASAAISMHLLLPPGPSRLLLVAPADPDPAGRGPISIVLSEIGVRGR